MGKYRSNNNHELKKLNIDFVNGTKVVFKKTNIIEIPDWSKNTEDFENRFGTELGYAITGMN